MRFAISAISVFCMKFKVEFTSQVMDFPIELDTATHEQNVIGSKVNIRQ